LWCVFASVDADVKVWVYRVYTPRIYHFKTEEEPVDVGISDDIGIAMDSLFSDKPMVPMKQDGYLRFDAETRLGFFRPKVPADFGWAISVTTVTT